MSKSDALLVSIKNFYAVNENSQYLFDVLEKRNGISLRNLEWFITNYSKQKNTTYTSKSGKQFTVHCAYKSSLCGYSKKLFDPFCRTSKFDFEVPNTEGCKVIQTTVAQLNFIRWCIINNIIDYMIKNKDTLTSTKKSHI